MRHILIISNSAWNVAHFRKPIVETLLNSGHQVTVAVPFDGYENTLIDRGVSAVRIVLSPSGKSPLGDLKMMFSLWRVFQKSKPDAILTFTAKPNIYGSLAARMAGIPVVPTISGLGSSFLSGGLLARLMKLLFRVALAKPQAVFFQNSDDRELFVGTGLVRKKLAKLVPGSGIDLVQFNPAPLPTTLPFTFLQIGRILGDKGIYELVQAARILHVSGASAKIILLGEVGADNPTAISRSEVENWVREGVVEHVPPVDDVRPWIRDAHAVVLASYREGLPRSLLEGAAMGRPLLASDVPGCRDVVENGSNGILFAPRSAESLAAAMRQLMGLPAADVRRMALNSRRLAERKFDKRLVATAYLEELSA